MSTLSLRKPHLGSTVGRADWSTFAIAAAGVLGILVGGAATWMGPTALAGFAATLLLVIAFSTAPLPWATAGFGALLPITIIPGVAPNYLDIARGLAMALLFVRLPRASATWRKANVTLAASLIPVSILMGWTGFINDDRRSIVIGVGMFVACMTVAIWASKYSDWVPFLWGYSLSVAMNCLLIVSGVGGVITVEGDSGALTRLAGVASSAPRASQQAAIALIVIATAPIARSLRGVSLLLRGALLVVVLAGLGSSGGRLGAAALVCAVLVATAKRWLGPKFVALTLVAAVGTVWFAQKAGLRFTTIERILPANDTGYSSGRTALIRPAIRITTDYPMGGYGLDRFTAAYGVMPHSPLLAFGIGGGLLATAGIVIACIQVLRPLSAIVPKMDRTLVLVLASMIATLILEPDGPFVGVELLSITIICICSLRQTYDNLDRTRI